jgi:excisionase family DNA binding protein
VSGQISATQVIERYVGDALAAHDRRMADLERRVAEKDRRIAELELRVAELAEGSQVGRWLTPAAAADYLGCSKRALYMRVNRGQVPEQAVKRQGRRMLFDRAALDRFLEAQR